MRPSILAALAALGSLFVAPAEAQPVASERAIDLPIEDLSPVFAGLAPDGSAFAVEAVSYDRRYLAVFDASDTSRPRFTVELTPMSLGGSGSGQTRAALTPHGERVVYQSRNHSLSVLGPGAAPIERAVCPDTHYTHLVGRVVLDEALTVAIAGCVQPGGTYYLTRTDLATGEMQVLRTLPVDADDELIGISGSPDGRWLTWTTHEGTHLVDRASLADAGWLQRRGPVTDERWSPDGARWYGSYVGPGRLVSVDLADRRVHLVRFDTGAPGGWSVWMPRADGVAVVSYGLGGGVPRPVEIRFGPDVDHLAPLYTTAFSNRWDHAVASLDGAVVAAHGAVERAGGHDLALSLVSLPIGPVTPELVVGARLELPASLDASASLAWTAGRQRVVLTAELTADALVVSARSARGTVELAHLPRDGRDRTIEVVSAGRRAVVLRAVATDGTVGEGTAGEDTAGEDTVELLRLRAAGRLRVDHWSSESGAPTPRWAR